MRSSHQPSTLFRLWILLSVIAASLAIPLDRAMAAPAGTALQFSGSNQHVTFGDTRLTQGTLLCTGTGCTVPTWNAQASSRLGRWSLTFNRTSSGASSRWFKGAIDEVRVYKRVLTPAEIQVLHGISPTNVTLLSFTATARAGDIRVAWETSSQVDILGFNLWRSEAANGEYVRLNSEIIPTQPGSNLPGSFWFDDPAVSEGVTYYYKLELVYLNGQSELAGPVHAAVAPRQRAYLPVVIR